MCDIYMAECPKCGRPIDMHLANYRTRRDEVEAYCSRHMPKERSHGVIWSWKIGRKKHRVFVQSLTPNASRNWQGNRPNELDCVREEVFGEKVPRKPEGHCR